MRVTPTRPGLAVWTASVDTLPGEVTVRNNARQVAVEVSPNKLGVLFVRRRAQLGHDLPAPRPGRVTRASALDTRVRRRGGWRRLEKPGGAPTAADLKNLAVVVLDGVAPADVGPEFDAAISGFLRGGGGLLVLGGGRAGTGPLPQRAPGR